MERGFWDYVNLVVRTIGGVAAIKTLVVFAVASGAAVTVVALWQKVPWYVALTSGCLIFASLVMAIVGLDYLYRAHGIKRKIALREVRVRRISFNEEANRLELAMSLYVFNNSTRILWIQVDRVQCQIDHQTHAPNPPDDPIALEVQPGSPMSVTTDTIQLELRGRKEFEGFVEIEARYGKKKGKFLRGPYKTRGSITLIPVQTPLGWEGRIMTTGGRATYD